MHIAIVHDYIKEYGGAERVLEELIKLFPDADIYTSLYAPEFLGPHKDRFEKHNIKTTFIDKIPFRQKLISPLRLLAPFAFNSLDLSRYDVVIVSQTGAYFPNLVRKSKNQRLICYTHTPPRYLYGYKTAREVSPFIKALSSIPFYFLRKVDFKASQNVDQFISNSEEVAARIKKFYKRDAIVIYPPVFIDSRFKIQDSRKEDYYLTGGRLARAKGIDVIVKAFNKNGLPLKVFGRGFAGYQQELESRIKNHESRIEFIGEITDEEKFRLMKSAKAFVFASFDEDFGITPVEALGTGTPVIAFRSGGVKETVVDGKTGVFYDENTPESLNDAIVKFEKIKLNPDDCIAQAAKFSSEEFDTKIKKIVEE